MDIKIPNFFKILILFLSFFCCYCFAKMYELTKRLYSLEVRLFELQSENHILLQKVNLLTSKSIEPVVLQKIAENGSNIDVDFYAGLFLLGVFGAFVLYVVFSGSPNDATSTSLSFSSEIPINASTNVLVTSPNNLVENVEKALNSSSSTPVVESFVNSVVNNSEKSGIALEAFRTWLQEQPYPLDSSFSVTEMSVRAYIYVTTAIADPAFHNSCVLKMQELGLLI